MIRILICALAFAAIAAFVLQVGSAQEGTNKAKAVEKKDDTKDGGNPRLGADAIIERLMAFDTNKDGKINRDELPERLQNLIEKGDQNKDSALDKDEIGKLAATPEILGEGRREGGNVNLERVVDDLGVRGEKRQQARAAVQAHQNEVRKFIEKSRADLLEKMKGILTEDEFTEFQRAVGRQRP